MKLELQNFLQHLVTFSLSSIQMLSSAFVFQTPSVDVTGYKNCNN